MKISTFLSYAGGFRQAAAEVSEFEQAGLDLVWVAEAYGLDGPSLMGYLAALTERVEIGSAILPIYTRTPTLIAMTAAGIDAAVGGALPPRSGRLRAPGDRGIPRRALRPPPSAAPGRSSRSAGRSGTARRRSSTRARLPHAAPARPGHGPGQGAQDHRPPGAAAHPDLGGRAGREERRHDGRGGRRLDPHASSCPRRPRRSSGRRSTPGRPSGTRRSDTLQIAAGGILAIGEGRRGGGDPRASAAAWPRSTSAAWGPRARTSTTRWPAATATRRRRPRSRTSTCRARRRRRRRWCRPSCSRHLAVRARVLHQRARRRLAEAGVTHLKVTPIPVGDQRPVDLIAKVKELAG